jgi:GNAT superfamily N-acetyltransferase
MTIVRLSIDDAPEVLDTVLALLCELGQEAEDLGQLDVERTMAGWRRLGERVHVLAARDGDGAIVGVLTLCEEFAIYANGLLGAINEMYVVPAHRSSGVGKRLIDEAKTLARELGWSRLDVTAPESARWERTRAFYRREGFTFAGPKLKYVL